MTDGFFAHPLALVETPDIGRGSRVWAWAHVMATARVGVDCNIGEHCFVESGARLGDRVTVKNGVSVWDGVVVEDDVFIGPHAVLTNDPRPRSRSIDFSPRRTVLRRGCSIGANATLLCGLEIGCAALVGAGAVVTRSVPDYGKVLGNPARLIGYVCPCAADLAFVDHEALCPCGRRFRLQGETVSAIDG